MVNTYTYFVCIAPFHIVARDFKKTLILSNKKQYKVVDSNLLNDFKEGEPFYRSVLIGESFVHINYFKSNQMKRTKPFVGNRLENFSLSNN
jgi:hypothetical protein